MQSKLVQSIWRTHPIARYCFAAALTLTAGNSAHGQANPDAIAQGKDFAKSMLPTSASQVSAAAANPAARSPSNAPTASPLYTTQQPAAAGFNSGLGLITQGTAAITKCSNHVATGNAVADQECAGVNFLANNPTTTQFNIQKTDPALTSFASSAASAINTESPGQQCVTKTITSPATFITDRCSQTSILDPITCNRVYTPNCAPVQIALGPVNNNSTGVLTGSITPSGVPGQYTFSITGNGTNGSGTAMLSFQIPAESTNSTMTITMAPIDDAGAVAVNGTTIWAGYPNAGPQISTFPPTASFVANYTWTEATGGGNFTFSADTKLQDSCPTGYFAQAMNPVMGSNTASYLPGFFCNGRGEFLMNRHEGQNAAASTLNTTIALQPGLNSIQVFWGTLGGGKGGINVSGSISLVAATCTATTPWVDGCAKPRSAL